MSSGKNNPFEPLAPSTDGVDQGDMEHYYPTEFPKLADFVCKAIKSPESPESPVSPESERESKLDTGAFLPYEDEDKTKEWGDCENVPHEGFQRGSYMYGSPTTEDYPSHIKTCPTQQAWSKSNQMYEELTDAELQELEKKFQELSQAPGNTPSMVQKRNVTRLVKSLKNISSEDCRIILETIQELEEQDSTSDVGKSLLETVAKALVAKQPSHLQASTQERPQTVSVCGPCQPAPSTHAFCQFGLECHYFLEGRCRLPHPQRDYDTLRSLTKDAEEGSLWSRVCKDRPCGFKDRNTGEVCGRIASKTPGMMQAEHNKYCSDCQKKMRTFKKKTQSSGPVSVPPKGSTDWQKLRREAAAAAAAEK